MGTGGTVINGSSAITTALIEADETGVTSGANGTISNGVILGGGTIVNYATIQATRNGAYLFAGGDVVNGPGGDTAALMSGGHFGVYSSGTVATTITNFGTIAGYWQHWYRYRPEEFRQQHADQCRDNQRRRWHGGRLRRRRE